MCEFTCEQRFRRSAATATAAATAAAVALLSCVSAPVSIFVKRIKTAAVNSASVKTGLKT